MIKRHLIVAAALGVGVTFGAPATAQTPGQASPQAAWDKAEDYYQANQLLEAVPWYHSALRSELPEHKRRGFERLLAIYLRLGRQDQAIRTGQRYLDFLQMTDDPTAIRVLQLQLGVCYQALGYPAMAAEHLQKSMDERAPGAELSPGRQLTARLLLALGASQRGDKTEAAGRHRKLESAALRFLASDQLTSRERIDLVWTLAEGYRADARAALAVPHLEKLVPLHEELKDQAGQANTLRLLSEMLTHAGQLKKAEKNLREALAIHEREFPTDRLTAGDFAAALADLARQQQKKREEQTWRKTALDHYRQVLQDPRHSARGEGGAVAAFWKLQALLQGTRQFRQALQLATTQAEQWAGGELLQAKLRAEQGALELSAGVYGQARTRLRQARADLEKQDPVNLNELPRALVNLAIVELATDELGRAESIAKECQDLYRRHHMNEDLILLETDNILGTCAAQNGDYAKAVDYYRAGQARCGRLGDAANPQHSNILLNLALLHKAQGDAGEAMRYCRLAQGVFANFAAADDVGHAAFDAAQANLFLAQGKIDAAAALSDRILSLCQQHGLERGPLVITARHCQALEALGRRDFTKADQTWKHILAIQEQEKQNLLAPRTLNYLGLSAELQGKLPEAEQYLGRAVQLQKDNARAFPATHFITQWRLANVADARKQKAAARGHLLEALDVVEKARYLTFGDTQQRAGYFAQFAPAYDQLVDWCVRDGDLEGALAAVARGRSRAFLDQLEMANVDPRHGLEGPDAKALLKRELQLRKQMSALRAKANLMPVEQLNTDQAKQLLATFDQVQRDYQDAWREIVNANPHYRNLAQYELNPKALAVLRERILGDKKMLLVYHLGPDRSQLLVIGPKEIAAHSLEVSAEVGQRAALSEIRKTEDAEGTRGLVFKPRAKLAPAPAPPAPAAAGPTLPLSAALARSLIDQYRAEVGHPDFTATRGLVLKPRNPKAPVPVQRLDLLGNIFLPPAARKAIGEQKPDTLIVIPDGALHKLPLEALVIEAGAKPRYVLDELPPMVYAPSLASLTVLAQRPQPDPKSPPSLLTVANPAYPQQEADPVQFAGANPTTRHVLGLRGQLTLLPQTALECRNVQKHFAADKVQVLEGKNATEKAVVKSLAGKRIIHLAVHGFADERFGNLFGALALTPPSGDINPDDDGFLSLHEIYSLPLKDCELAVLSACATYVGPQQPLEAGVTLASGFLAAGARRVVASHWNVDDASTAELMSEFFGAVAAGQKQGMSYAQSLQRARQRIRNNAQWSSPFYWAPFVLIGPAD